MSRPWPPQCRLHVVTGKGGTGKTTVAAALALALAEGGAAGAAGRGRGAAGHRPALRHRRRCRTRSAASRSRRAAARCSRWPSTPSRRCSSTSTCSTTSAGPARALKRFGAIDFATTLAPGLRDVLLTGKVKEVRRTARRPARRRLRLRRRGAGRAADRPDHPVPRRHHRGRRAWPRSGRSTTRREASCGCCTVAADRRPPGHAARGDAGAGDDRRRRRAARAGLPARARSSSTWPARRWSAPAQVDGARRHDSTRARLAAGLERGRHRRGQRRRAAGREAAEHAERRRARGARARARWTRSACRVRAARCSPTPVELGELNELAADLLPTRDRGMTAPLDAASTRPRCSTDPTTRIIVCCGSGGVGKTTTAAALALRAAERGRRTRGADHRPGPPAGPVDGAHRARQHPARGRRASTRPTAASCTR